MCTEGKGEEGKRKIGKRNRRRKKGRKKRKKRRKTLRKKRKKRRRKGGERWDEAFLFLLRSMIGFTDQCNLCGSCADYCLYDALEKVEGGE